MDNLKEKYIDLHLHLDGSLSPEFIIRRAKKEGISLPSFQVEELLPHLRASKKVKDLNDYLKCFRIPGLVLQSERGLIEGVLDVAHELALANVFYAELRYAPQKHLEKGLDQEAVIRAVIKGIKLAEEETSIKLTSILCCMRGASYEENMETLRLASKFMGKGVVAIDLAGAEALYPNELYETLFKYAYEMDVPYIIHAGEALGPDSVKTAIEYGARRIGHGVHAVFSEEVMTTLKNTGIPLELCLSSNLQTGAIQNIEDFPLRTFLQKGLVTTINTDNMTVSNTNIEKEFELLKSDYGLTKEEELILKQNAIKAAFTKLI